jgi:deazaflavin-dependent oxidoreductase (nitroreductase family)
MSTAEQLNDAVSKALSRPMQVVDITTRGRQSGKPRRIEIVLHNIDGRLYISGQPRPQRRSWLANLDANAEFNLHLKQGLRADLQARAREITDPNERRTVLEGVARHWKRNDVNLMVEQSPLIEVTV